MVAGRRSTVDFVAHREASKIRDTLKGNTIETTEPPNASSDGFEVDSLAGDYFKG
jgi:hypothetical protein